MISGLVQIYTRPVGQTFWRRRVIGRNTVTNVGRNLVRDLMLGTGLHPTAIAVGTGTAGATAADTELATEVFRGLITRRTGTQSKATFQLLLGAGDANGNTLTEAGILNSSVAGLGDLLARFTYGGIDKTSSIEVTYTWDISGI